MTDETPWLPIEYVPGMKLVEPAPPVMHNLPAGSPDIIQFRQRDFATFDLHRHLSPFEAARHLIALGLDPALPCRILDREGQVASQSTLGRLAAAALFPRQPKR